MFDDIKSRVFFLDLKKYKFNKIKKTKFSSVYDEKERNIMIDIFKRKNPKLFNGNCVRLESIEGDCLNISIISYYDFLLSTIILSDNKKWLEICENDTEKKLILDKCDLLKKTNINDITDILNNNYLSNTIAVSVLVKRSNNLSVSG